jgi:hypothetical protein
MFEVTRYDHPHVFVTRRATGETYKFSIGSNGALTHPEAHQAKGPHDKWLSNGWLRELEAESWSSLRSKREAGPARRLSRNFPTTGK